MALGGTAQALNLLKIALTACRTNAGESPQAVPDKIQIGQEMVENKRQVSWHTLVNGFISEFGSGKRGQKKGQRTKTWSLAELQVEAKNWILNVPKTPGTSSSAPSPPQVVLPPHGTALPAAPSSLGGSSPMIESVPASLLPATVEAGPTIEEAAEDEAITVRSQPLWWQSAMEDLMAKTAEAAAEKAAEKIKKEMQAQTKAIAYTKDGPLHEDEEVVQGLAKMHHDLLRRCMHGKLEGGIDSEIAAFNQFIDEDSALDESYKVSECALGKAKRPLPIAEQGDKSVVRRVRRHVSGPVKCNPSDKEDSDEDDEDDDSEEDSDEASDEDE